MTTKPVSETMGRLHEDMKRERIDILGGMTEPRHNGGLLPIARVEARPERFSAT